jgi:hypothetical protein
MKKENKEKKKSIEEQDVEKRILKKRLKNRGNPLSFLKTPKLQKER